jgi:uncharacterized membrane protein (DUF106 family)
MDDELHSREHREIIERLSQIENQVLVTQKELAKLRKFMFWRLIIVLIAVFLPALAIPYFLDTFLTNYFLSLESLLQ